jgi:hypothetical protein
MIITQGHQLYNTDLELYTGEQRSRLNGSDIDLLRAGGWDLVLYEPTTCNHDTEIHGELELTSATTCTRLPVAIPIETQREGMSVSSLQFRLGLNAISAQMRADFEAHILGLSQDEQDKWTYSILINRNDTFVETFRVAVAQTEATFDTLFINSALL